MLKLFCWKKRQNPLKSVVGNSGDRYLHAFKHITVFMKQKIIKVLNVIEYRVTGQLEISAFV